MPKRQIILECLAALLILLLVYASLSKFIAWQTFYGEMKKQPLPRSWIPYLVWTIPFAELLVSSCLAFERTRLIGFYAALAVMGIFSIYAILILSHVFPYVPCSCGGVIRNLTWGQHLSLNLFFVAVSTTGIILQHRKKRQSISSPTIILSSTLLLAVCTAFVTKPHFDCTTLPQYFQVTGGTGAYYLPVGQWYGCMEASTTCTYFTLNGGITYSPCTVGAYNNCAGCAFNPEENKQ